MTTPSERKPGARPPQERPAAGARIMVGGISLAAGLGLVGAMGLAASTSTPPPAQVVRVVVVDDTTPPPMNDPATRPTSPAGEQAPHVVIPAPVDPPPAEIAPPAMPDTTTRGS